MIAQNIGLDERSIKLKQQNWLSDPNGVCAACNHNIWSALPHVLCIKYTLFKPQMQFWCFTVIEFIKINILPYAKFHPLIRITSKRNLFWVWPIFPQRPTKNINSNACIPTFWELFPFTFWVCGKKEKWSGDLFSNLHYGC